MSRRIAAGAVIVSLLTSLALPSAYAGMGTTGAQFLKIGVGAKAVGMGEAYSAIADDASAIYWNPAGIAQIKNTDISATHMAYFQDITYQYLAGAHAVSPDDTLGLMVNYLSMPSITKYDNLGNELSDSYTPMDMAATVSWGRALNTALSAGLNIKYLSSRLDTESASTIAADLGVLYKCAPRLSLAATVHNMGNGMKFISATDPLPMTARVGSAYAISKDLTVALDADYLIPEASANGHLGGAYALKGSKDVTIMLRAGYRTENANAIETAAGVTAGVGFDWKNALRVDVAWAPYGNLGEATQVTLGYRFGTPRLTQTQSVKTPPPPAPPITATPAITTAPDTSTPAKTPAPAKAVKKAGVK